MDEEQAKALASGPLGEKMAKFPLLFAKAVFFGEHPSSHHVTEINNGTVTLANLGEGPLAITCQHVLAEYRERREKTEAIFQIGNVKIDPIAQMIDENARLDLATIRLTQKQAAMLTSEGEIGSCFFKPRSWPPHAVKDGDFVAFGGFPGSLRTVVSCEELEFGSWSSGASKVCSVSDFQFVSSFERDFWVQSFGSKHHMNLSALGGMSGGPALISRGLCWDLVGIVSNYHESYDTVLFSSLRALNTNGTIQPPPI